MPDPLQDLTDRVAALEASSNALASDIRSSIEPPLKAVRDAASLLARQVGPSDATLSLAPAFLSPVGGLTWEVSGTDATNPGGSLLVAGAMPVVLPQGVLITGLRVVADVFVGADAPPGDPKLVVVLEARDIATQAVAPLYNVTITRGFPSGESHLSPPPRVDNTAKLYLLRCTLEVSGGADVNPPAGVVAVHAFQIGYAPPPTSANG